MFLGCGKKCGKVEIEWVFAVGFDCGKVGLGYGVGLGWVGGG